jgi:N-acetylmuramic acid 6-phosphate (MurNAc-6-P) etherase
VTIVTGAEPDEAGELLRRAKWNVKAAIIMKKQGSTYTQALRRLRTADQSIREALGEDLEPTLRRLLAEDDEAPSR